MFSTLKQHPKGLYVLFLTELWERFGFYTVQGMLVLFMTGAYHFADDRSYAIMGSFSALAYISPVIGGYLADHHIGYRTSIIWGGLFLSAGYALIALPFTQLFYPALATIIVGNGFFKPNISGLVGKLYKENDSHRESGFTLFYVGINLGVLLAGVGSGYMKESFGWHVSFGMAAIGMLIGLCTFGIGLRFLKNVGELRATTAKKSFFVSKPCLLAYSFIAIVLLSLFLASSNLSDFILPVAGVILLVFLLGINFRQTQPYRSRFLALIILIFSSIVFWMLFLQMFFSLNLFIERLVNREIFHHVIPTTVFYTLESVFVILLGPGMAVLWHKLNKGTKSKSLPFKFGMGVLLAGVSLLLVCVSTHFPDSNNLISAWWIVLAYLVLTLGELVLSPIGLSAVTELSPQSLTGMMLGVWFVALGFGGKFAGFLAKWSSVPDTMTDHTQQLAIYGTSFLYYGAIACVVALIIFMATPVLNKMIKG